MVAKKQNKSYEFPDPMESLCMVGHKPVQSAFLDAWRVRDTYPMHPVWMLTGPRGIGKATLAYHIARFIFRESAAQTETDNLTGNLFGEEPLNQKSLITRDSDDHEYQKMLTGGFGDFFVIDMAHNLDKDGRPKTDGKIISVYTVRSMIERMQMSSMEGGWRVVIIDSVDELNQNASNAILKLLEEPPANTLFLLVTHSLANTLPTIRSRARVEKMNPLSTSELRELFYKFIPDEDVSPALLKLANGSFGKIADLKKNGGDDIYEELLRVCQDKQADSATVMTLAAQIAKNPALYGILLDAAAHFGLADLYPTVAQSVSEISHRYLEPEVAIFKIITEIKKCL